MTKLSQMIRDSEDIQILQNDIDKLYWFVTWNLKLFRYNLHLLLYPLIMIILETPPSLLQLHDHDRYVAKSLKEGISLVTLCCTFSNNYWPRAK